MVGEDPIQCIKDLAPFALTNHFRDSRIEQTRYGCKIVGCALGAGDLDLKKAYGLLQGAPNINRINIEIAVDAAIDSMEAALFLETEAMKQSVDYCRKYLNITNNNIGEYNGGF